MYHILPESEENVIGIKVIDSLTSKDYATLLPFIDGQIQEHGIIRILSDMRELKNPDIWAGIKVTPRALRSAKFVEKEAVITDEHWLYVLYKLCGPFFKTEIRVFPSTELDKAWEWVRR